MINKVFRFCLLFMLIGQIALASPLMQPVIKDGRYYYSADDTYEHIDMKRAFKFLGKKLLSPSAWKNKILAYVNSFYNVAATQNNDTNCAQPLQTIPPRSSIQPNITWIGHASFLIQINGFNILTDPIFGNVKAGPFTVSKRVMKPGICLEDLPPIDAIVISHNHSDHTDTSALMAIAKRDNPMVFIPQGDKALFEGMGFSRVIESNWWDKKEYAKNNRTVTFTFLPAYHWSIRFSLASYRQSLWGSWMIQGADKAIYFAGDSAYGEHFKQIAEQFPAIDVALMPIGPTAQGDENRHKYSHVDASQAVDAFCDLNAWCFIPMHYGTFFAGPETLKYPLEKLAAYWDENAAMLKNKRCLVARCGKQYRFK